MKNLSFFKGLIIGCILAASVWAIAIFSIVNVFDKTPVNQEADQVEIYAANLPS